MKQKIGLIIGVQITIIVFSFLILVYFENQSIFLGNSINISGKNRFLAEFLYTQITDYQINGNQKPVIDIMTSIDKNILSLSNGGIISTNSTISSGDDIVVMAVPPIFSNDLKQVQNKWSSYKSIVENILDSKKVLGSTDLNDKKSQFISAADDLTYVLGKYSKEQVSNLIFLQLLLLGINIIAHVFLIKLVLNIIRRDYVQKLLIDRVSNDNRQLSLESKISLLQKDILESFLDDMKNDLQKLKNQVSVMDSTVESENNRFVFHEIMHNLSARLEELAGSKKRLDDSISYYQKLNLNLAKSLSVISDSKQDVITKTDNVIMILKSYVDSVNILASNQNIPSHLGKRLTDTMYEIIDSLEQSKIRK